MLTIAIVAAAVILIVVLWLAVRSKGKDQAPGLNDDTYARKCSKCNEPIPKDYMKSLCPQCKTYLAAR